VRTGEGGEGSCIETGEGVPQPHEQHMSLLCPGSVSGCRMKRIEQTRKINSEELGITAVLLQSEQETRE